MIGVEMASVYASLGKAVTIVEAAERILPPMDREISQNLAMILKKRGVTVFTSAMVSEIRQGDDGLVCHFTDKKGEQTAAADVVLISVGRRPCTAGLFADGFAVEQTERGFVAVDETFRTSVPTISAIGDVIGRMQLAHAAEAQGIAAVELISGQKEASVNFDLVPSCVYTTPEIASVGITADDAKKAGREVVTGKYSMNGNAKTIIEQPGQRLYQSGVRQRDRCDLRCTADVCPGYRSDQRAGDCRIAGADPPAAGQNHAAASNLLRRHYRGCGGSRRPWHPHHAVQTVTL